MACAFAAIAVGNLIVAQRDLTDDLDRAVADLSSPTRHWHAASVLARAGAEAVPRLAPFLATHREHTAATLQAALLIAGRANRTAVALLPSVLDVYRFSHEPLVRRQALWAAGEIAPFVDAKAHGDTTQFLVDHFTVGDDLFQFACVRERLALAPYVEETAFTRILDTSNPSARVIALCDAFATQPLERAVPTPDSVLELVLAHLERKLARPLHPWDVDTRFECEAPSLAKVAWMRGSRAPLVARALLQHWDPDLRLAALVPLQSPAATTVPERWDVVAKLWDGWPEVRSQSLATMTGWGDDFAIAVPGVLACTKWWPRAEAAAAQRAIERWMRDASPFVAAAVAMLRGERAPSERLTATDRDRATFAQLVMGCRGLEGAGPESLAAFARTQGLVTKPVVSAFLWCVASTGEAQREAMRALVALGPSAAKAQPDIATELLRMQAMNLGRLQHAGPVAEAWMRAGPAATSSELEDALECDHWCVAARALVEVLHRGEISARAIAAAAAVRTRTYEDVSACQGEEWSRRRGLGFAHVTLVADHESLSALATLVLLAADDARWRDEAEWKLLLSRVGESATVETLLEAKQRGELPALAREIEAARRPDWLEPTK